MNIEFKNIPNSLDKDKDIIIDGIRVGGVSRGWLRNGGEQWVADLLNRSAFGEPTLIGLKHAIKHQISKC